MNVRAECHSDDHAVKVRFDAVHWLKQASLDEIKKLAACGWGGDYGSDKVAEDMARKYDSIYDMFKYIEARNKVSREHIGFECHVNKDEALAWLLKNRKRAHAEAVKAEKEMA